MQLNIRNRQVEKWSFWSSYSALFRNELRLYFTYIVHTLCLYSMSKICKQRAEENNVILFIFKGVSFTICNIQFDPHKSGTKKLQSRSLSSYSTLYTAVPHWKLKDRFKGVGPTVFHEKYLVLGRDISYFVKKKNTGSTKMFPETDIWVFDWQHICCYWWTCFSTDSRYTYGYKLYKRLFSSTFFIWMRQTSYRDFSRKMKRSYLDPLISHSAI